MKARWFWSRWLLPPCDDEIHHSCREAERMLQACGEEMVMTAVNSIPFYFHTTDSIHSTSPPGFPMFSCPCNVTHLSHQFWYFLFKGIALVSSVLKPLVEWSVLVFQRAWGVTDGWQQRENWDCSRLEKMPETWRWLTAHCLEWACKCKLLIAPDWFVTLMTVLKSSWMISSAAIYSVTKCTEEPAQLPNPISSAGRNISSQAVVKDREAFLWSAVAVTCWISKLVWQGMTVESYCWPGSCGLHLGSCKRATIRSTNT